MSKQKLGSLKYQITQRLKGLNRLGESKHQAKEDYKRACATRPGVKYNPAYARGIFSSKTMDAYKQSAMEFSNWFKENHPDIRDINNITKDHTIAYLQQRQTEGKSAWTTSKDMSALNKVFNLHVTKSDAGLRERSYKNTTRSREDRAHDSKYNPKNYEKQIAVSQAFGLRRESIYGGQYQVKDVSLFRNHNDGKLYAAVIEKGGRYREAPCLSSMQPTIERMYPHIQERDPLTKEQFQALYHSQGDYLFDKYTTKIDNHAFRHEYARNLYQEIMDRRQQEELQQQRDQAEEQLYRGYNRAILEEVSQALGHNRVNVVVEHYLR